MFSPLLMRKNNLFMTDRLGNKVRLMHILDAIGEIEKYTTNVDFNEFSTNSMLFSACVRQLEIVGEAVNRLSDDLIANNPEVEWRKVAGLRNMLIHEYFGIDDNLVWSIIQKNIPDLKGKVSIIVLGLS
jgi:uncharacterized protein with HEPN domain